MFRHTTPLNTNFALGILHEDLGYDDHTLALHLGVAPSELMQWRMGASRPHPETMNQIRELVALSRSLANCRNGKYRWA
jgi:hypothetical protein